MNDRPEGYPETPELDKLEEASKKSQPQGEFLTWLLHEKGYVLAEYHDIEGFAFRKLEPASYGGIEKLLAEYHGIDLTKVAEERTAVLQYVRQRNEDAA